MTRVTCESGTDRYWGPTPERKKNDRSPRKIDNLQSNSYLVVYSTGNIVGGFAPARNALALGADDHRELNTLERLLPNDGPRFPDPPYLTVTYGEFRGLRDDEASQARDIERAKSIWSNWESRQA